MMHGHMNLKKKNPSSFFDYPKGGVRKLLQNIGNKSTNNTAS